MRRDWTRVFRTRLHLLDSGFACIHAIHRTLSTREYRDSSRMTHPTTPFLRNSRVLHRKVHEEKLVIQTSWPQFQTVSCCMRHTLLYRCYQYTGSSNSCRSKVTFTIMADNPWEPMPCRINMNVKTVKNYTCTSCAMVHTAAPLEPLCSNKSVQFDKSVENSGI